VLFKAYSETSPESGGKDEEIVEDESKERNEGNVDDTDDFDETLFDGLGDNENDEEGEDIDESSDSGSDKEQAPAVFEKSTSRPVAGTKNKAPRHFFPAAILFFMLYGPYGVAVFNLEVNAVLNMDTNAIDEGCLSKTMNTEHMKDRAQKTTTHVGIYVYTIIFLYCFVHIFTLNT
jgi:hypothetical protein